MVANASRSRLESDLTPSRPTLAVAAVLAVAALSLAPISGAATHAIGLFAAAAAWTAALLYYRRYRQLKNDRRFVNSTLGSLLFSLTTPVAVIEILFHSWYLARWLAI